VSREPTPGSTIVAISTPPGTGAIGVIRVSGPGAVSCAGELLSLDGGKPLSVLPPRALRRARIVDPESDSPLDEALVVVMPAPRSYTGEDVVEISTHGNPVLLARVVHLLVGRGTSLAEPGEFTRRAFLNGRIDLLQAEAVAAIIGARSERALRLAARQLAGSLSGELGKLREAALDLIAGIEVALDFPEDEIGPSRAAAEAASRDIAEVLESLLRRAEAGRAVDQGLSVVLAGAPNVGKSSLLNRLLGKDRAIVSPEPGTTRDLVEGSLVIAGVPVRLLDGAGLGTPRDAIDDEAMRRSREALEHADLAMVILDRARPIDEIDRHLLRVTAGRDRLVVANKVDLPAAWSANEVDCACSALSGTGVTDVLTRLTAWVDGRATVDAEEGGIVASLRVTERIADALRAVEAARHALARGVPLEAVLIDLRDLLASLDASFGIQADDAILDRIFASFCVGK